MRVAYILIRGLSEIDEFEVNARAMWIGRILVHAFVH